MVMMVMRSCSSSLTDGLSLAGTIYQRGRGAFCLGLLVFCQNRIRPLSDGHWKVAQWSEPAIPFCFIELYAVEQTQQAARLRTFQVLVNSNNHTHITHRYKQGRRSMVPRKFGICLLWQHSTPPNNGSEKCHSRPSQTSPNLAMTLLRQVFLKLVAITAGNFFLLGSSLYNC